jgi:hypothetical protein
MRIGREGRPIVAKNPSRMLATAKVGAPIPLFYRKRTSPQGGIDEISFGPSGVNVFRCLVGLILGIVLIMHGGIDPSVALRLLLRLLRGIL